MTQFADDADGNSDAHNTGQDRSHDDTAEADLRVKSDLDLIDVRRP